MNRWLFPPPCSWKWTTGFTHDFTLVCWWHCFADIESGAYRVEDLIEQDYRRVRELCDRYADADIGFVDAAVVAVVERLNEPKVATLDHRHFGTIRPRHVDALALLP